MRLTASRLRWPSLPEAQTVRADLISATAIHPHTEGAEPSYCPMIRYIVPHSLAVARVWTASGFVQRSHRKHVMRRVVEFQKARDNSADFALLLTDIGSGHPAVWGRGEPLVCSLQLPDAGLARLWGACQVSALPTFHTSFPQFPNQ